MMTMADIIAARRAKPGRYVSHECGLCGGSGVRRWTEEDEDHYGWVYTREADCRACGGRGMATCSVCDDAYADQLANGWPTCGGCAGEVAA